MAEQLFFPLTMRELQSLENGKLIRKHYHLKAIPRLDCIVWNKDKTQLEKKWFETDRKQGISFANIPCGEHELQTIKRGDCVTAHYGDFDITVVLKSRLRRPCVETYASCPSKHFGGYGK